MTGELNWFYKSKPWRNLLDILRAERTNAGGLLICEHCGKPILRKYDCIGHHKIELTKDNVNDANIALNPDNIALIHFKCHNQIHERFTSYSRRVYLVYGAPCSGKSSYVAGIANKDDLILDLDKIYKAICTADLYEKAGRIRANVFGIRDCILDQIRVRKGRWRNAFVIGGYPLRTERDRLCDLLDAIPVYIEASREECLDRAKMERPDGWSEYVDDWFDTYVE